MKHRVYAEEMFEKAGLLDDLVLKDLMELHEKLNTEWWKWYSGKRNPNIHIDYLQLRKIDK
jgi:hypothetical protein